MTADTALRQIRLWLAVFIAGLVMSGITAFPLTSEIGWLSTLLHARSIAPAAAAIGLLPWIERVHAGLTQIRSTYPFLAYGTDWLAFAHVVIAVAFIGPCMDPVRNRWVITFGLIACAGVLPMALIAGAVRGIPLGWRLVDCSFGLAGAVPLLASRRLIQSMEAMR